MADLRRWTPAFAALVLVTGFGAPAHAQNGLVCTASAPTVTPTSLPPQPTLRQEGFTELTADILLTCVGAPGATPTPTGAGIPQANITVSLSAPVTSRVLGGTSPQLTEALLLVDDPSPGATYPALGNQDPCLSPLNPAVACQVLGDGGQTFNQPGKFNVFQGIESGPGSSSITFLGVPVDPPGGTLAARTYRITNVRIDATGVGANNFSPVLAFVTASPSTSIQIDNSVNAVGFVSYGLTTGTSVLGTPFLNCQSYGITQVGTVTFTENFATAFKVAGGAGQNVPGTVYYTESGLEIAVTGTAGPADTGTRLQAVVSGIPLGVTVWVDDWAQSTAATVTIPSDATLVAGTTSLPSGDPGSSTPRQALPGNSATFVWEVTKTNSSAIDSLSFNIYVSVSSVAAPGTAAVLSGFNPQQPSATSPMTGPIPEFSSTVNVPVSATNLFTISPCVYIFGEAALAGTGLSGVKVALSGSQIDSAITDGSGRYSFTVAAGGNYTVTPSLAGYIFRPPDRSFTGLSGSQRASFEALQDQTITFGALANQLLSAPPFPVSATASSGLAVTFASASTAFCTVSGTTVTLVSVGVCTIQATQTGNTSYAPATPVYRSFQVTATPVFTTLHSFDGTDGTQPYAGLVQATNGDLYGTTSGGGANGYGTVFKITPGGNLTTLYSFCSQGGCTDGSYPSAGLVQATNGDLYGTTEGGGTYGSGTVFKFTLSGTLTTLYSFCSQTGCTDGANPYAGLVQAISGDLYGTTSGGGGPGNDYGTIFRITPSGALTTLYNFCSQAGCTDGYSPYAALVQAANGDFYGTTQYGGVNHGTVFKITPSGTLTTLHSFEGVPTDGCVPEAGLVQAANGSLYGTTSFCGADYDGTVFKITPSGTTTTLYSFGSQGLADGGVPFAGLIQATDGNFYGTTYEFGADGGGTVFRIAPSGALTTLYNFCSQGGCADGGTPAAGLIQGTNGDFYGTTVQGGTSGLGTVFSLSVGLGPFVEAVPTSGAVGRAVEILGTALTGAMSVSFNGAAATFTVNPSGSAISTTVPAGATTGKIQVVTPTGTLSSNVNFRVLP